MISIQFLKKKGSFSGFEAKGHALSAPYGSDIVCAAVSSACIMAANTITEVIGAGATAKSAEGRMVVLLRGQNSAASDILAGLFLHLTQLSEQYPENVEVTVTEV